MFKGILKGPSVESRETSLAIMRIFVGLFMIYHGWEIFDPTKMKEYSKWMIDLKLFYPSLMAYIGKAIELLAGFLLLVGLFTRIAVIPLGLVMLFITFFIGKGRIFMEEQHPFLFVLLSLLFLLAGPGRWSLDKRIFYKSLNGSNVTEL